MKRRILSLLLTFSLVGAAMAAAQGAGNPGNPGDDARELEIRTDDLRPGVVGLPYRAQLRASGGARPYTWALGEDTTAPDGLTLDADGMLTGTPTSAGEFDFLVVVTDANGATDREDVEVEIRDGEDLPGDGEFEIVSDDLHDGYVDRPYRAQLRARGGVPPYRWMLAEGAALPDGLGLGADGVVSGTPTVVGEFLFAVVATDAEGTTDREEIELEIEADDGDDPEARPLEIKTTDLRPGYLDVNYRGRLVAVGGARPYQWLLTEAGEMPPGLTLNGDGSVVGVPTRLGTFTFVAAVTDSNGDATSAPINIEILETDDYDIEIIDRLPFAFVDQPYEAQLHARGGVDPLTWELVSGALPEGLSMDETGLVTGTPTTVGEYEFDVRVTDANGSTDEEDVEIEVVAEDFIPLQLGERLPRGLVGEPYEADLRIRGGVPPYVVVDYDANMVPPGLALSEDGTMAGTPEEPGAFIIPITIADSEGTEASGPVEIMIMEERPAEIVILGSLARAYEDSYYEPQMRAQGGTPPLVWSGENLPAGMSLSADGLFSGAPEEDGRYWVTFIVTDADNDTARREMMFVVLDDDNNELDLLTERLPTGILGVEYRAQLRARGGNPPYTFQYAPTFLPPGDFGLMLSEDGKITGIPQLEGEFELLIQVQDADGNTDEDDVYLRVVEGESAPLMITTQLLRRAPVGTDYRERIVARGGMPPYTFALINGTVMPDGLELAEDGIITGVPTTAGEYVLQVQATDAAGDMVDSEVVLPVVEIGAVELVIVTDNLPRTFVGVEFRHRLQARGGLRPYKWELRNPDVLPDGVEFDDDGIVEGETDEPGEYPLNVRVTDARGATAAESVLLVILNRPHEEVEIMTERLRPGRVGTPYRANLVAKGGQRPYAWAIAENLLPAGLRFDVEKGQILGTPEEAGEFEILVNVEDANGAMDDEEVYLVINSEDTTEAPRTGVDLGAGWSADWFGTHNDDLYPWVFHLDHQFIYVGGEEAGDRRKGMAYYTNATDEWFWTSEEFYPFVARFRDQTWHLFSVDNEGMGWFQNLGNGEWTQAYPTARAQPND